MKLNEIAERISTHLHRFENDPAINVRPGGNQYRTLPYWHPGAAARGRFVYVRYVSFQLSSTLSKDQATRYLEWLDAGNVGRHFQLREAALKEQG